MPRIVHLVIGVHDLERAAQTYGALGFNTARQQDAGSSWLLGRMAMGERCGVLIAILSGMPGGTAAAVTRYLAGDAAPPTTAHWHIRRALVRSIKWLIARHRRARGRQRLATFSDRMLRDIGTDRSMVEPESTSAFWRLR